MLRNLGHLNQQGDGEDFTLLEEINWRQKLRDFQLNEGDRCTKFFHQVANYIDFFCGNDVELSKHHQIIDHIMQFYYRLYTKRFKWRPKLDGLDFKELIENAI